MTITLEEKPKVKGTAVSFAKIVEGWKTVTPAWAKFTAPDWQKPVVDYAEVLPVLPPMVTETLAETFLRELRAVITEAGPNYHCPIRYSRGMAGGGFSYVHEGKGDCLVGRVLIRMGHSAGTLSRYEGMAADIVIRHLYGPNESALARVAAQAQQVNDSRAPWGYAISIAV